MVGLVLGAMLLGGAAVAFLYKVNSWNSPDNRNSSTTEASPVITPRKHSPTPTFEATPSRAANLSGDWMIVNTVEKTSYPDYANLRLGYRLTITQTGVQFRGEGEKYSENGIEMDASQRTALHVNGSVSDDTVTATFVEEGLRRTTTGRFEWTLSRDANQMRGSFASTAAKSSGSSIAARQ